MGTRRKLSAAALEVSETPSLRAHDALPEHRPCCLGRLLPPVVFASSKSWPAAVDSNVCARLQGFFNSLEDLKNNPNVTCLPDLPKMPTSMHFVSSSYEYCGERYARCAHQDEHTHRTRQKRRARKARATARGKSDAPKTCVHSRVRAWNSSADFESVGGGRCTDQDGLIIPNLAGVEKLDGILYSKTEVSERRADPTQRHTRVATASLTAR